MSGASRPISSTRAANALRPARAAARSPGPCRRRRGSARRACPSPRSAATVAPTLVPFESSYQLHAAALAHQLAADAASRGTYLAPARKRLARHAERARQRARGERVRDVVRAVDRQLVDRERSARRASTSQPSRTPKSPAARRVEAERDDARGRAAPWPAMPASSRFSTCTPSPWKMRAFAAPYSSRLGVAVEVILAEVQHRRGARIERPGRLELVAGQLQHPGGRRRRRAAAAPRAPAARCCPPPRASMPALRSRCAGERGDRALAVGAGDREHRRAGCASAKSSTSPSTGMPRARALRRSAARRATRPGLMHTRSTPVEQRGA